jgi:hypothetical protein
VTHYDTLGVPEGAGPDVVREAYKELARRFHPDTNALSASAERARTDSIMREVNEAWAVLRDPDRRAAYDRSIGVVESRAFVRSFEPEQFVPIDDTEDDDAWLYEDDEGDPASAPRRSVLAVPIVLSGLALLVFASWMLLGEEALLVTAVILAALAAVAFFALPMVAMAKAARGEVRSSGTEATGDRP